MSAAAGTAAIVVVIAAAAIAAAVVAAEQDEDNDDQPGAATKTVAHIGTPPFVYSTSYVKAKNVCEVFLKVYVQWVFTKM